MIARPDLNFKLWDWAVGAGGLAGKAWAGELIHTSLLDVNDLLARGALGKLEGGDGVRSVCGSNRDANFEINWNLTPISLQALLQCGQMISCMATGTLLVGWTGTGRVEGLTLFRPLDLETDVAAVAVASLYVIDERRMSNYAPLLR
jgi:hypothetical protein